VFEGGGTGGEVEEKEDIGGGGATNLRVGLVPAVVETGGVGSGEEVEGDGGGGTTRRLR
jgi:hypothetical protein